MAPPKFRGVWAYRALENSLIPFSGWGGVQKRGSFKLFAAGALWPEMGGGGAFSAFLDVTR